MVENGSNFSPKVTKKFHCQCCDYFTSKSNDLKKHLSTDKHQKKENDSKMVENGSDLSPKVAKLYYCTCGKVYKHDSGYYRHKKKCLKENEQYIDGINIKDKDALVLHLLKQNGELQNKIIEMAKNTSQITNNTNSHNTTNNAFNLNFFLNETCKDAMNISDFVSSIKLNLEDLEHTGRQGYIEGISKIIINNLNNLEQCFRPLHCSDLKREVLYIKNNDKWEKETSDKPILTKAIKTIANQNIRQINSWKNIHPDCTKSDSKKNDLYLKIVSNSMNGLTEEESEKNINKIITNIAKETVIKK